MSKKNIIEDVSTTKAKNTQKRNKQKKIAIATILSVVVVAVGIFCFLNTSDPYKEDKEALKEIYEKVDVELKDTDFVVKDNHVEVTEDKKEEAKEKSSSTLSKVNASLTKSQITTSNKTSSGSTSQENSSSDASTEDGSDATNNPDSPDTPDNPDTPNIPDEGDDGQDGQDDDDIVIDDITQKINEQLAYVKDFMQRSFEKKYYGEPLKQLIADMRAGNTNGDFDNMSQFSNQKAFGVFSTLVYSSMIVNMPDVTWTEDYLFLSMPESNTLYNVILNEAYNSSVNVDILVQDESKTYNISGKEVTSTYVAYCGETPFYLDAECNILDVG